MLSRVRLSPCAGDGVFGVSFINPSVRRLCLSGISERAGDGVSLIDPSEREQVSPLFNQECGIWCLLYLLESGRGCLLS